MTPGSATAPGVDDQPCAPASPLLCVFAVCRTGAFAALPPGAGHPEGGAVTLLALDEALSAVVQEVPADRFTEDAVKQRLADRDELESCARAHHATVTAAAGHGPLVPLPLATLFTGAERVRGALTSELQRLRDTLEHLHGRDEWAVKVYLRQSAGARPQPPSDGARGAESGAGRAYIARIRERERDRLTRDEEGVAAAAQVHKAAGAEAVDCVQRRPHGPEITGQERRQLMNAAYLVPRERSERLRATLLAASAGLAASGVEIEVSGPWVPYSFAEPTATPAADTTGSGSAT